MAELDGSTCVCKQGYYNNNPSGTLSCAPCSDLCSTCSNSYECDTCLD